MCRVCRAHILSSNAVTRSQGRRVMVPVGIDIVEAPREFPQFGRSTWNVFRSRWSVFGSLISSDECTFGDRRCGSKRWNEAGRSKCGCHECKARDRFGDWSQSSLNGNAHSSDDHAAGSGPIAGDRLASRSLTSTSTSFATHGAGISNSPCCKCGGGAVTGVLFGPSAPVPSGPGTGGPSGPSAPVPTAPSTGWSHGPSAPAPLGPGSGPRGPSAPAPAGPTTGGPRGPSAGWPSGVGSSVVWPENPEDCEARPGCHWDYEACDGARVWPDCPIIERDEDREVVVVKDFAFPIWDPVWDEVHMDNWESRTKGDNDAICEAVLRGAQSTQFFHWMDSQCTSESCIPEGYIRFEPVACRVWCKEINPEDVATLACAFAETWRVASLGLFGKRILHHGYYGVTALCRGRVRAVLHCECPSPGTLL